MKTLTPKECFSQNQEYDFNYFDITCDFTNIHNHEFYEFFLVINGEGTHVVNGIDHLLAPDMLVCLRPEDVHTFIVAKGDKIRILNLAFCSEVANDVLSLLNLDTHYSFNIETSIKTTKISDQKKLYELTKLSGSTRLSERFNQFEQTKLTVITKSSKAAELTKTFKVQEDTKMGNKVSDYATSSYHHQLMKEQTNEIVEQYQSFLANEHRREIQNSLLKMFFSQLISKSIFSDLKVEQRDNSIPTWLKKAISDLQMKENYENGLVFLLDSTGKSQSYLCRMFQKHLNCSPSQYINSIRLKNACNLLRYTKISIAEICFECGFLSISHFNHLFKIAYEQSPTGYRKRR